MQLNASGNERQGSEMFPVLHISNAEQADGYRSAQTPVSTLSSAPDEADNCGSIHRFTACRRAW